jgi:hypothetical protein
MKELVDNISAAAGLEPETARKAVGIVLDFIQKSVPPARSAAVIDKVPGGREAAAGAAEDEAEGGGTAMPGLMGLADRLMAEGVGMGHMQPLGRAMFDYLRRHAGDAAIGDLAADIPGLSQFM